MSAHVVVIASLNIDLVVVADRLPLPGETVLGGEFATHDGGKGANQAVAAARVGARVSVIGAVGNDAHGERAVASLAAEGIDTSRVRRLEAEPTGVAIIAVGPRGENQIVVAPGANALLELDDDDRVLIGSADVVLTSHEVPPTTAIDALRTAHAAGITAILNPAPARALSSEILSLGPILTPNEHELVVAIGNDVTDTALDELAARHQGPVIVTQGPAGALLAEGTPETGSMAVWRHAWSIPPGPATRSAASWPPGSPRIARWAEAIDAANAAGALSVGAVGARAGMPTREALDAFLQEPRD